MARSRGMLFGGVAALVCLIAIVLWVRRAPAPEENEIDLVDMFPEAEKRTNVPSLEQAFAIENVTIGGQRMKCIYAHPSSRIIYDVVVPPRGVLDTSFAVRPEAWGKKGNGVQFRIGVAYDKTYEELLRQHVDPISRETDRMWHSVVLDLSAYQGRTVKVILNTDPGVPGTYGDADTENDFSVWAEPRIYSHR